MLLTYRVPSGVNPFPVWATIKGWDLRIPKASLALKPAVPW